MKSKINVKELCKLIKYYGNNGALIWSKQADRTFISNRHFLVHFEELPREVLAALFSVFYKLPEVGETIVIHNGTVQEKSKPIDFANIFTPDLAVLKGENTAFLREINSKRYAKVINFESFYTLAPSVNHQYRNAMVRGRRIKALSKDAQQWADNTTILANLWRNKNNWGTATGKVIVRLWFFYPDNRKRDTHNSLKLLLDCLEDALIYENDKFALPQIMDFQIDKKNPRVELEFERTDNE